MEWEPYERDEIFEADLSDMCRRDDRLWRSVMRMIFFVIVEVHIPTRVLRQFGRNQRTPPQTVSTSQDLHR